MTNLSFKNVFDPAVKAILVEFKEFVLKKDDIIHQLRNRVAERLDQQ